MMRVRILGSAAGGGLPQWNCSCRVCEAARGDGAIPRTQSSIAFRSDEEPWFLVNASPDLRQQLSELPVDDTSELRSTPFAGVIVTDGEIDHAAGLLLLRESSTPLRIYCTEAVRAALTDHYPVLAMLQRYCGVEWRALVEGGVTPLEGSSLEVEAFATGGDAPLYMGDAPGPGAIGLTVRDANGSVLCYAPAIAQLDRNLVARMRESDCVLADGTFWQRDELVALGLSERDAIAMGHVPLSGPGGTLDTLAELDTRTILVHINNTNPILLEDSPERAAVRASGVDVGYDGLEIEL
jgi:pyrroloquinoline quinone biosynthesis protein B